MEIPINRNRPLVMHIDLNSCFATVAQQANIHLRGKPLVIAAYTTPRGCVLAPSIEAKQYGIKTGMRVMEAKMLCPDVIVRTADTVMIRDVHMKFRQIFSEYSTDVFPKSIDEAVIDFSPMQPVLNKSLLDIGKEIKMRLRKEVGEWISCSVGIGTNRFLAKTAASYKKPDGLVMITHENLEEVLGTLQLTDLYGINTRFEARLNAYGIFTPLQFLHAPLFMLRKQVFKSIGGFYWYQRLRGYEVDSVEFTRKSIGQEYSLGKRTDDPEELSRILMKLCEKMGRRLRRKQLEAYGMHVGCLYSDWSFWHKGKKMEQKMYTTFELFNKAQWILNQQPAKKVVGKLMASCYDLKPSAKIQATLFDEEEDKERNVSDAVDTINDRYGEFTVIPALMMDTSDVVPDRIAFGGVKELEEVYY